jgi:hypothetical protein
MHTLQIRLLGDFSITVRGEPVAALNKPRLQSLLAYLLLHHEVPQFRYYLANLLWPDSREAQALTNLRKLLFLITQALPPDCALIQADNQTLQWNKAIPFNLDVDEFQRLLSGIPSLIYPWKIWKKRSTCTRAICCPVVMKIGLQPSVIISNRSLSRCWINSWSGMRTCADTRMRSAAASIWYPASLPQGFIRA